MKQVIIRIRDYDGKLVAKEYFTSFSQYYYDAKDYIFDNLMSGMEVQVKVGNQCVQYKLHSELIDDVNDNVLEDSSYNIENAIYDFVRNDTLMYYVKKYLPNF